ncbi:MAG: PHP domain-containing protein [Lachnospiraceae bacterium]|nr:PHP domain-containing protein [Lachnospiraceae bacterium]
MDKFVERQEVLKLLNAPKAEERLANLAIVLGGEKEKPEVKPQFANNHIHTIYSFSPYSPTAAVYCARDEGLQTAGIMDHDSIAGAVEFRKAGKIAGIGTTCGMECRANLDGTSMEGRKLNNPDQAGITYMAIHSVPDTGFARLQEVFGPLREKRNERNRKMVANINGLMEPYEITLDFDRDVLPLSQYENGGSVTERHLLCALSEKMIEKAGKRECADFVEKKLGIALSNKQKAQLSDPENPHFVYDLLGVMKAELVEKIYIPATEECISFHELVKLADEVGAILCYPYLGDVTNSVTGDKKAAKFEDDFLVELFEMLKAEGVHGVTYMPARNTKEQMTRLQKLCREYGMTEISGEDVNSSRQSMICKQLEDPQFKHLVDATWKLIEREKN